MPEISIDDFNNNIEAKKLEDFITKLIYLI